MIVPFPNPDNLPASLVEFPDRETEEAIFIEARRLVPSKQQQQQQSRERGLRSLGRDNMTDTIQVYQAGGYQASVATNYADLMARVDWAQYSTPANFTELMDDLQVRFGKDFGFVIAEPKGTKHRQPGGAFAWIYHGHAPYLPTAHEKSAHRLVEYNVTGFVFTPERHNLRWGDGTSKSLNTCYQSQLHADRLVALLQTGRPVDETVHRPIVSPITPTRGARIDVFGHVPVNDNVYSHVDLASSGAPPIISNRPVNAPPITSNRPVNHYYYYYWILFWALVLIGCLIWYLFSYRCRTM